MSLLSSFARVLAIVVLVPGTCVAQGHAPVTNSFQKDRMQALLDDANARYALVTRPSDTAYHRVDVVELEPGTRRPVSRLPTLLSCNRLHADARGQVLCFSRIAPGTHEKLPVPASHLFTRKLQPLKSHAPQAGLISRARISADGRYTATTAFVTGHGYMDGPGRFSTATLVGGGSDARAEENIQQWQISRDGARFAPPDINLWGVSFDPKDSNRFFVTVQSGGVSYLGKGEVSTRRIEVQALNAECPSFSPDGRRLAFKKKVSPLRWAPAVLDLATRKEQVFDALPNSIDDQIEWLDNDTLLYEVTRTPLLGKPRTDLMSLDLRAPVPRQSLWLLDARSPTFVGPR